jgi:threonine/homoserine/homoserine lactone efflux protein
MLPVTVSTLLLFAGATLALALTPGPDMLFCLSRSIGQGRQAGFASLLGIATGLYVWAGATALGLASLIALVPTAYHAVRLAGAAYLAWLAWQAFAGRDALSVAGAVPRVPLLRLFRQGLVTNLLNPKIALFFLALFPQFVDPARGSTLWQILALASVFNLIGFCVNGAVILAAGRLAEWLRRRPGVARYQRWFMGTVFGGLALRLALETA